MDSSRPSLDRKRVKKGRGRGGIGCYFAFCTAINGAEHTTAKSTSTSIVHSSIASLLMVSSCDRNHITSVEFSDAQLWPERCCEISSLTELSCLVITGFLSVVMIEMVGQTQTGHDDTRTQHVPSLAARGFVALFWLANKRFKGTNIK